MKAARQGLVMTRKINTLAGSDEVPFDYGNTFKRETVGGQRRLRIGVDQAHDAWAHELASCLAGPFQLLYVLHTTRTGAAIARYESPELSRLQLDEFLRRFGPFLSQDSRHDFWLRSHDDEATIVLDRHNVIYAYGPLPSFEAVLLRIGAVSRGLPRVPDPHVHYYHAAWDESERHILTALPWIRKPLRESDVQASAR